MSRICDVYGEKHQAERYRVIFVPCDDDGSMQYEYRDALVDVQADLCVDAAQRLMGLIRQGLEPRKRRTSTDAKPIEAGA